MTGVMDVMAGGSWDTCAPSVRERRRGGTVVHEVQPPESGDPRMAGLVKAIESEVVPRLMLARRAAVAVVERPGGQMLPDAADVTELTRLLLAHDAAVANAFVEAVHQRGVAWEAVCLQLLAPAARELGRMWEEDTCDFVQVTVGLCRLHEVLRDLSRSSRPEVEHMVAARSILLAPVPGEQHTFGLLLVAEFFRRAGWDVTTEFPAGNEQLLAMVSRERFSAVGLSIAHESSIDGLARLITEIRRVSRNRSVAVMLGGRIVVEQPELGALVGADATAVDGRQAAMQADGIVRLMA